MRSVILPVLLCSTFFVSCVEKHKEKQPISANVQNPISEITLKTTHKKDTVLHSLSNNKATVFIFLSPECPLCKSYSPILTDLCKKYKNDNISFYGIFPGRQYPIEEIQDFEKYFPMGFPLMLDTATILTHLLGASVTPEVFVTDSKGAALYSGRIDNWAYDVSKKRQNITEHNLDDVLNAIVSNSPIAVNKTQAVGCFIETTEK